MLWFLEQNVKLLFLKVLFLNKHHSILFYLEIFVYITSMLGYGAPAKQSTAAERGG